MQQHLTECLEISKTQHAAWARGRGSLVTLLSKDTINKIVQMISHLISQKIASEVTEAKMFSIQIDTTQDIRAKLLCDPLVCHTYGS